MHATTFSSTFRFSKTDGSRPTIRTWNGSSSKHSTTTRNHTPARSSKPRWPSNAASTRTGSRLSSATRRCLSTTTAWSTSPCQQTMIPTCVTRRSVPSLDRVSPAAELSHPPRSPAVSRASELRRPNPLRNASACTVTRESCAAGPRHHRRRRSAWRQEHLCREIAARPSDSRRRHPPRTIPHTEMSYFCILPA